MEQIGARCHNRCDAGHPSLELYRGEVGIGSNAESDSSIVGKGFGQMAANLTLLRVDQDNLRRELAPKL